MLRYSVVGLVGASAILFISCATVRPPEASFSGTTTFSPGFKPLRLNVTALGSSSRKLDAATMYPPQISGDPKKADQELRDRAVALADCGIAAMYAGDVPLARKALDEAMATMGGHVATAKDAQARDFFFSTESKKTFRGEPHERAVVFLYRGLLYMAEGDAENAQACFKSGALQDALASGAEHRSDWLTIDLMLLVAKRAMKAADALDWQSFIAKEYSPGELPKSWQEAGYRPVVFLLAAGEGPIKQAEILSYGELTYVGVPSRVRGFSVVGEENATYACNSATDNCLVQAATRGKREMDKVIEGQAKTRRGLKTTAKILGAVISPWLQTAVDLIAEGIHSEADTRRVGLVPGEFYMVVADASRLGDFATLQVLGDNGQVLAKGTARIEPKPGTAQVVLAQFAY